MYKNNVFTKNSDGKLSLRTVSAEKGAETNKYPNTALTRDKSGNLAVRVIGEQQTPPAPAVDRFPDYEGGIPLTIGEVIETTKSGLIAVFGQGFLSKETLEIYKSDGTTKLFTLEAEKGDTLTFPVGKGQKVKITGQSATLYPLK